ncbi:NAD(P)H-hydrate dehydratase [Acidobacteria bacterium AH-259-G07]|nr:NAD(P)H-hydrate dehydratase [Acidobacteria bacterium AH-259-G07]
MKILSAKQMNEVDRLTTDEYGIPSLLLMENAGLNLYTTLEKYFEDLESRHIAVICGKGNNGGDGLVLARQLVQRKIHPDVYLLSKVEEVSGDAQVNLHAYLKSGARAVEVTDSAEWGKISEKFSGYEIIVDALLGTGIGKPLSGLYSQVVSTINSTKAFVLSVDIPSGMFSDSLTGGVQTVRASASVTFTAPKIAHILNEDQEAIGELHIVPIGSPSQLLHKPEYYLNLITREQILSYLHPREIKSHKGHFGHVAIVAGSLGKTGAAVLSAHAALRTGAGLVTAYTPDVVQQVIASFHAELMTEGFPSTGQGTFAIKAADRLLELLEDKNAAAVGPGLGREKETVDFVHKVVRAASVPLVLDADALNAFECEVKKLKNHHDQPLILTPHPGEFSRLMGRPIEEILSQKVELCRQFAQERGVWLVLKSFRTLIAEPQGQVFACPLGNSGMATAGMGDVLTGVLASLLGTFAARGMSAPNEISHAVLLGVYLHSLAGDLAAFRVGLETLTAGDVTAHLAQAYQELAKESHGSRGSGLKL